MWTPLVGTVCLQAAYVLPAVVAGGGLATAAWFAVGKESRTALAAAAGLLAAASAAWGALSPGMSQVGGLVAAIAVVVTFLGFNFESPVAPHLVLAVSLVGLAGGCLVFLMATWLIAPRWASDACLSQAGEGMDALVRMMRAEGGGGWRFDEEGEEEDEKEEKREEKEKGLGEERELFEEEGGGGDAPSSSSSPSPSSTVFLGASGEPSRPRIPPRLKRLFQKKGRRRAAAAAAKAAATTTTTTTTNNDDEEAPRPLPPQTQARTQNQTLHHRAPAPGYNRPSLVAGRETLSEAARAWVELSSSLDAAEALLKPAAGEAFWGHVSLPECCFLSSSSSSRFRVMTPALPPPMWPLLLRRLTGAHVVPLGAGIKELSAALRASARLCWTMRNLSSPSSSPSSSSPPGLSLAPTGPVAQVAQRVYFVPAAEGGEGGKEKGKGKGKRKRNLLREWQAAAEGAAAAAARAVPRSFSSLLSDSPPDSSSVEEEEEEDLRSSLETLRAAAEALAAARERASSGETASAVASLLSKAAGDESGESFAEEARFGAWEGGVAHAVANAERVGRAVEALRGMMPR